ncbi:ATP-binding protein [Streptomyces sp. OF3]|uniref:ATP-binding protein n=1 Tax=Streptomyces alkaliterrae TaxID=2213162 RepID=A0A7W3ZN46_9ACTN|nr:ATP-binding protein [Streptomyces alkaliterrae]MBB1254589.1 ATP-binding protein [Streptomyces alkaliterrae]
MCFTSTPRGARLARRLVAHRLNDWGHPYNTPLNETFSLITAELCANAVRHGRVPGRDFHVRLVLAEGVFRVEVTDTRAERLPPLSPPAPDSTSESGRGLHLVAALADGWGVTPRPAGPGKSVWAELRVPTTGGGGPRGCVGSGSGGLASVPGSGQVVEFPAGLGVGRVDDGADHAAGE